MDVKLKYSADKIVEIEFKAYKPGYDPLKVDQLLDEISEDYLVMRDYIASTQVELEELRSTNKVLNKEKNEAQVQLEILKQKLSGIGEDDSVSYSNLELIQRINLLEGALFKLGVDPTKIK